MTRDKFALPATPKLIPFPVGSQGDSAPATSNVPPASVEEVPPSPQVLVPSPPTREQAVDDKDVAHVPSVVMLEGTYQPSGTAPLEHDDPTGELHGEISSTDDISILER